MAHQKLSMSETPIAGRDEAIGRGPGPWKEAPDPKNGVGGMAKPFKCAIDVYYRCPIASCHIDMHSMLTIGVYLQAANTYAIEACNRYLLAS